MLETLSVNVELLFCPGVHRITVTMPLSLKTIAGVFSEANEIELSRIPLNNGDKSRSGWTKIQEMYENCTPTSLCFYFDAPKWNAGNVY